MRLTETEIISEDSAITVSGGESEVALATAVVNKLLEFIAVGEPIDKARITYLVELTRDGKIASVDKLISGVIAVTSYGKPIKSRTIGQNDYVEAIRNNAVVFGVGPAGTGKTYLAVASAVAYLKSHEVERIILTRPAVEAGERLGFLPGDLQSKIDPYLRPLFDALQEMLGGETYQKLIEKNVIEIAPLAYMRGRTLNKSFIILDEAQNATREQMKMFLTRLGDGSKMVINGDVTQIDLPEGKSCGLLHAATILQNVDDIKIVKLTRRDVVRNPLVTSIIKAYEENSEEGKPVPKTDKDKNNRG